VSAPAARAREVWVAAGTVLRVIEQLAATRESYDLVAREYAEVVPPRFDADVVGRGMLGAFAELVDGPVADLGCGPGQVTAYLAARGADVFGVDVSPGMVGVARERYPALRFEVGAMAELAIEDATLGGIVAWWSIVHTPPESLPAVFAEFRRVLKPGGHVILGFHTGDGHRRAEHAYGHDVTLDVYRFPVDRVVEALGMTVTARLLLGDRQACLLARLDE
jgi:SAM-dependent methyltransferase